MIFEDCDLSGGGFFRGKGKSLLRFGRGGCFCDGLPFFFSHLLSAGFTARSIQNNIGHDFRGKNRLELCLFRMLIFYHSLQYFPELYNLIIFGMHLPAGHLLHMS